ncbi:peptidoglycan-binding domain-containing protein [Virgibacillus natechei]|uniref:peptidoglycan-binding domain-containing protein n=1 Tax=Virgibacillus sp. CBA3643 TaxID=2942278 RepID=UPI0035A29F42
MSIDNQYINAESHKRWIEMLQRQLIRENPSALPNYGVDGIYGEETTDWVSRFQERKGLVVDGLTGPETLGRLRADIVQLPGTTGRGVEILQEDLLYFYIQQSAVDGVYGAGTEQGVRDFQFYNNLLVDGEAGPNTLYTFDELITTILSQRGDNGSLVRRIQQQLNEQESVEISIEVDGVYGAETEQAVENFQGVNEQYIDGIAGPITMNLLDIETVVLNDDQIEAFLQSQGYNLEVEEVTDEQVVSEYVDLLESNDVLRDNVSTSSKLSDKNLGLLLIKGDVIASGELYFLQAELNEDNNKKIFATFDDINLDRLIIGDIQGELYDSKIVIKTYDVDGNEVESVEDTFVELSNANVDFNLGLYEYATSVSVRDNSVTNPCTWLGGAAATIACGVSLIGTGIQPYLGVAVSFVCTTGFGSALQDECNS